MGKANPRITLVLSIAALLIASPLLAISYIWEAEAAGKLTGKAFFKAKHTKDPGGKVSGNQVLATKKIKPGERRPSGIAEYRVKLPQAGTYYLWARVRWSTYAGENSHLLSITGIKGDFILGGDGTYDVLHWIRLTNNNKPMALKMKKSVNTFTLEARSCGAMVDLEAKSCGAMVDQFLLTTDLKMVPSGLYTPTKNLLKRSRHSDIFSE